MKWKRKILNYLDLNCWDVEEEIMKRGGGFCSYLVALFFERFSVEKIYYFLEEVLKSFYVIR